MKILHLGFTYLYTVPETYSCEIKRSIFIPLITQYLALFISNIKHSRYINITLHTHTRQCSYPHNYEWRHVAMDGQWRSPCIVSVRTNRVFSGKRFVKLRQALRRRGAGGSSAFPQKVFCRCALFYEEILKCSF